MVTTRQAGRWFLYALGGCVTLLILVRVGIGIYLNTPAGKSFNRRGVVLRDKL